jgi:energy-converting hydrogenase Eha subunit E
MSSPQLQLALWVSQPFLQAIIGVVLFRRNLHKEVPAFFGYTVAQIILCGISFPVHYYYRSLYLDSGHNYSLYFVVYYAWAALNVIFAFKIIHEVFLDVFRPYPALKDLGTALFRWAAMIMILVSVVMVSMSPGWDDPVRRTINVVQLCVDVIQCGLVIFLLAFSHNLGVSWHRLSFGVALGFGLASCTELLTHALHSGLHIRGITLSLIDMTAYEVGLLLWLGYCVFCKHESVVPVLVPQRWDDALMDIQPHDEAESLIPMFEHMVEQAFSKTRDQHV